MDTVPISTRTLHSLIGSAQSPLRHDLAPPVYDGLHAWCRAQVAGETERHTWNPPR